MASALFSSTSTGAQLIGRDLCPVERSATTRFALSDPQPCVVASIVPPIEPAAIPRPVPIRIMGAVELALYGLLLTCVMVTGSQAARRKGPEVVFS